MDKKSKIFVAGHSGLVGSAIVRKLTKEGYKNLLLKTHKELDLMDKPATNKFFDKERPEFVFLAAAKVGGILANATYPAEFIYNNLTIQNNIIHAAYTSKVSKLLFLGSSCIYPKLCPQPIKEDSLLTGSLEPTNEWYAIAKIAGIKMCQAYNKQYGTNFISVMPTNLYGTNDNFDLKNSHVLPALIRKFHEAKIAQKPEVIVWGTGKAKREFLYVDDLADACVFIMQQTNCPDVINIGSGEEISIKDLAKKIAKLLNYKGKILWDKTKPDGTPRKLLELSKLKKLGWKSGVSLDKGITLAYNWYRQNAVDNQI